MTATEEIIVEAGKIRGKKSILAFIGIGIILTIFLCAVLLGKESKDPVPMDNIVGSEVNTVSENDFELEW